MSTTRPLLPQRTFAVSTTSPSCSGAISSICGGSAATESTPEPVAPSGPVAAAAPAVPAPAVAAGGAARGGGAGGAGGARAPAVGGGDADGSEEPDGSGEADGRLAELRSGEAAAADASGFELETDLALAAGVGDAEAAAPPRAPPGRIGVASSGFPVDFCASFPVEPDGPADACGRFGADPGFVGPAAPAAAVSVADGSGAFALVGSDVESGSSRMGSHRTPTRSERGSFAASLLGTGMVSRLVTPAVGDSASAGSPNVTFVETSEAAAGASAGGFSDVGGFDRGAPTTSSARRPLLVTSDR